MTSEQLKQVREACKERLLDTLMALVRENGVDYNDYYRNEHGIEPDEGGTIGKVFDIANFGCHLALPLKWCDGLTADVHPLSSELAGEFCYHAYWSLYIERDKTGYETLMLYQFFCSGVCWDSKDAEPDHSPASEMSLAELDYLTQAIYWHLKRDIEKDNETDKQVKTMSESKYPFSLVDNANENLKQYGKEIQVVEHADEPGNYCVDVLDIDENGNICGTETYADNYSIDDLPELVSEAWAHVVAKVKHAATAATPASGVYPEENGVRIWKDGHTFLVPKDWNKGEWPLLNNKGYERSKKSKERLLTNELDVLLDWDFVAATKLIQDLGTDIPLKEGEYMITGAVHLAMYEYRHELNKALRAMGAEEINFDEDCWLAQRCNGYIAWSFYANYGSLNSSSVYGTLQVRTVSL